MVIVTASFLSFFLGLFGGFTSLGTVDNKVYFAMSMGGTASGAGLGSLTILSALSDYVRSHDQAHTT